MGTGPAWSKTAKRSEDGARSCDCRDKTIKDCAGQFDYISGQLTTPGQFNIFSRNTVATGLCPRMQQNGQAPGQRFQFTCVAEILGVLQTCLFLLQSLRIIVLLEELQSIWGKEVWNKPPRFVKVAVLPCALSARRKIDKGSGILRARKGEEEGP